MTTLPDIVLFLGRDGAIAGLAASDLTIAELHELSPDLPLGGTKVKREDLIRRIVDHVRMTFLKSPAEMMSMEADDLREYFMRMRYSKSEIIDLLELLEIRPGGSMRRNLADFAAREISDIGMFKRVAQGKPDVR